MMFLTKLALRKRMALGNKNVKHLVHIVDIQVQRFEGYREGCYIRALYRKLLHAEKQQETQRNLC